MIFQLNFARFLTASRFARDFCTEKVVVLVLKLHAEKSHSVVYAAENNARVAILDNKCDRCNFM